MPRRVIHPSWQTAPALLCRRFEICITPLSFLFTRVKLLPHTLFEKKPINALNCRGELQQKEASAPAAACCTGKHQHTHPDEWLHRRRANKLLLDSSLITESDLLLNWFHPRSDWRSPKTDERPLSLPDLRLLSAAGSFVWRELQCGRWDGRRLSS